MDPNLTAAQAALTEGRNQDAIGHLMAAVEADAGRAAIVYRMLALNLFQAGRVAEAEAYAARGAALHPDDFYIWNIRGASLRKLKRLDEARAALERAVAIDPADPGARNNLGNVLIDMEDGPAAETAFAALARELPESADIQRQLGRARLLQGKREAGLAALERAVTLQPDLLAAWIDQIGVLDEAHRYDDALAMIDRALAANPAAPRLLETRAAVLFRANRPKLAESYLLDLLAAHPQAAWLHYYLGRVVGARDRPRALGHLRQAMALEPDRLDYVIGVLDQLGQGEGADLDEAYALARSLLPRRAWFTPAHLTVLQLAFTRFLDDDAMRQLGDFATLGRKWAAADMVSVLMSHIPRVSDEDDRRELLEQHRIWGRLVERRAAAFPIAAPPLGPPGERIRLGFLSSDLRNHPVGYFAEPLFEHVDPERFELFVYSTFRGEADALQAWFASKAAAYRWQPDIAVRDQAQVIAADRLDMLIDLGASTAMNRVDVMAWRPAPRQASWLGYPHSAGLADIDHLILDPHLRAERDDLLIERPLLMPDTWIAMGRQAFAESHAVDPVPPCERLGYVTFGTANNGYKYSPAVFAAWARVLAEVPDSRFALMRPEALSAAFRANALRRFEAEGIAADRIDFLTAREPIRRPAERGHMHHYNAIDITLDTFPLTGGATTCEALWMGVPVVSLVGPAHYERLSYSILVNAGLADLCAWTLDDYVAKAAALAADPARLADLRANQRQRLKASPLGQTERFARDFYDMIERAVRA